MRQLLIIEDDEAHRELVENCLEQAPRGTFVWEFAGSLAETRERLLADRPDLILLDLSLPDSSPKETLPTVIDLAGKIPIIVLTSLDDRKTIMGMIQQGAKDCVPKAMLRGLFLERTIQFCLDREEIMQEMIERQRELERVSSFRKLFEKSRIGFIIGSPEARLIEANPAFAKWLGYGQEELKGMHSTELTAKEYQNPSIEAVRRITSGESEEETLDKRYVHKDGHQLWGSVILQKLNWAGYGECVLASVYDMTSHKEAEALVEAALERETNANKAKTALISMLGHDIRSPITSMLSMVNLIETFDLPEEEMHCVRSISKSGYKLLDLIDDILEFSRVESGNVTVDKRDCRITPLIESLSEIYQMQAKEKGVFLQAHLNMQKEIHSVDIGRIEQILTNFLTNAIKFTPRGGSVHLHAWDDEKNLCFAVEDSGIGIDSAETHRLFKPFSQANKKIHQQYGGTGLGLSICKQIADLMESRIELESTPGKGSKFTLVVPID